MGNHFMDSYRRKAVKVLLVILAMAMAGFLRYCPQLPSSKAKAAEGKTDPIPASAAWSPNWLDSADPDEPLRGLSLHGAKVLELRHIGIGGKAQHPGLVTPSPGFELSQRLHAEVEGIWPGIWVRGSFDDDPFLPHYVLQVDVPNTSFALGDVDIRSLSPPLSSFDASLTGAQGVLAWDDFTFSMAAGHAQTLTETETFALHPTTSVYHTHLAPILEGTETLRVGDHSLTPGPDYIIDYDRGRIQLMGIWPEMTELTITYQVSDGSPGRKPLVQGLRATYQGPYGTLGLTHLSRSQHTARDSIYNPFPQTDHLLNNSLLTWSTLSWEQGTGSVSPHWAAEIWRRTSLPATLAEQTVEDMEAHTLRQPLYQDIPDPLRWSPPKTTSGSSLYLSQATGWLPTERVTRSGLQLDFILEGSGAGAQTDLVFPKPVNLETTDTLLLTLGLPQPLPGIQMELTLVSGTGGSFQQSVALGNLVGWQDIVLAHGDWTTVGIPTWERITGIQVRLNGLLPGSAEGQVILGALDGCRAYLATDRWQSLGPLDAIIEIGSIPLSTAPWLPPPGNTALSLTVKQLDPDDFSKAESSEGHKKLPQVLALLPRSFAPAEVERLSFWVHSVSSGVEMTVWLMNSEGKTTSPLDFLLLPGWHQYSIDLAKPAGQLEGKAVTSIVLAVQPAPKTTSATLLLDQWQLEGMRSTETYMARFAASRESGPLLWQLTGSGQTGGFQWDAPGMAQGVPNHLGLEAVLYRPGNKRLDLSLLQQGVGDGQTTFRIMADVWDRTTLEGKLAMSNSTDSSPVGPSAAFATGHLKLKTNVGTSTWKLSAFQQRQTSLLAESWASTPWEARMYRGIALEVEQYVSPGVLHFHTWHLEEGATGQRLSADLDWRLFSALPVNTSLQLLRYQASSTAPTEFSGFGRWETMWRSLDHSWAIAASLNQMVGREKRSSIIHRPGLLTTETTVFPADPLPWEPWAESPQLWQQEAVLSLEWHPSERLTLRGRWQGDTSTDLKQDRTSRKNTGTLSISWPWGTSWGSRGALNWSWSQDPDLCKTRNTEYLLSTEGALGDNWSAGLLASHRQTRWESPSTLSDSPERGNRWVVKGHTEYAYTPSGSIGLGLALSHQRAAGLGPGDDYRETLTPQVPDNPGHLSWQSVEGISGEEETEGYGVVLLPGIRDAAGTYLDTQVRWALVRDAYYRVSLGTLARLDPTSEMDRLDYYGQASMEKDWGALGTSRLELSAGLGSQTAWAVGLGWEKNLLKGSTGLYLKSSLRHVQREGYHFTGTRLGIEYRF